MNTGDWVESCTAVVEHYDGTFELIRWAETTQVTPALAPTLVEAAHRREGGLMRLLIARDAWRPQVNGVVRSLEHMAAGGAAASAPKSCS